MVVYAVQPFTKKVLLLLPFLCIPQMQHQPLQQVQYWGLQKKIQCILQGNHHHIHNDHHESKTHFQNSHCKIEQTCLLPSHWKTIIGFHCYL